MNTANRSVLVGLIGAGIQASRTPGMHEREARFLGIPYVYRLIDLDVLGCGPEALSALLVSAERMGFDGLNITHPCKQAILPLLTSTSDDAAAIGAVNTVVLRNGERIGYNTDWWGFAKAFELGLADVATQRVLLLGAGGAGAAVAYALLKHGIGRLDIYDAANERAVALATKLATQFDPMRVQATDDVAASMRASDGLVHATPTGMTAHPGLPLPAQLLKREHWVAEIVYFPLETELLRVARARGCRVLDGSGMAVYQAVRAFELFTGIEPDARRMRVVFANLGG